MNDYYYPLEGKPTDGQKQRLDAFLREIKTICRKYRILIDVDEDDWIQLIDLDAKTRIGFGLSCLSYDDGTSWQVTSCDATGSILDGVWMVDTPTGPMEQIALGHTWPRREDKESRP